MIELGGLVVKAGLEDLTGDNRATIYGALFWIAEKLNSKDGERARGVWTKLGQMALEADRLANSRDRSLP
ncbi:MAG: conjugal transfer protein TraD [Nitrobacter sp.]|nr:conjugal transfer protein TraD [Nitrobacter sp.]